MIKLWGCVIIIASAAVFGRYLSMEYIFRIRALEELIKAVTVLKCELFYSAPTISDICMKASEKTEGEVSEIFASAAVGFLKKQGENAFEIWSEAVDGVVPISLTKDDMAAIKELGRSLGHPSKQMQSESIEILLNYINSTREQLYCSEKQNSKLYRSMSVIFGMLVAVVLF